MSTSLPRALYAAAVAALALVLIPVVALAARAPWSGLGSIIGRPATLRALWLSLIVATSAATLCVLLGLPLALMLARTRFRGRSLVRGLAILPLVAPPVVGGVALLSAFGRRGLLGRGLAALGITLPFTTGGAVVAAAFVALPLVVIAAESGLRTLGTDLEQAAETMGASSWMTLRTVTLPRLAPQIAVGFVLAWARALGEFGATITFAGNISGRTQTLPLAVYETLQTDPDGAIMLSVVLMAISLIAMLLMRRRAFGS